MNEIPDKNHPFFSINDRWFLCDKYRLKERNNRFYIAPAPSFKLKFYCPFDRYPEILMDFFELYMKLPLDFKKREKEEREKQGRLILEFVEQYGLFGLMWRRIYGFRLDRREKKPWVGLKREELKMQALINSVADSLHEGEKKTVGDKKVALEMDYTEFVERYMPDMSPPYPDPLSNRGKFCRYYAEEVSEIKGNIGIIGQYYDRWIEYEAGEKKPAEGSLNLNLKNFSCNLGLKYSNGGWHLNWSYRTLFDALALMYVLNFTDQMGGQAIRICQHKPCGRPFPVGGKEGRKRGSKYCSEECGNAARVARYRRRITEE